MKIKPVKLWVTLLIIPIPLMILTALLQVFVIFVFPDADFVRVIVNLISLLAGTIGVVLLLGFPIWLVMLVKANKYNDWQKSQGQTQFPAGQQQYPQQQPAPPSSHTPPDQPPYGNNLN